MRGRELRGRNRGPGQWSPVATCGTLAAAGTVLLFAEGSGDRERYEG